MSVITKTALSQLGDRYDQILELTPEADHLLGQLELARQIHSDYASTGFVKVHKVLPEEPLIALVNDLWPILSPIAQVVIMHQQPTPDGKLSDGARFRRVDPYCAPQSEKLTQLLEALGLTEFGSLLASKLTPLIRFIAGPVTFRRGYFYLYKEEDYLSVHDDYHVGKRVDVQFPVTLGTTAGVRVLSDGLLRVHYDSPGSMNVLGPCVWHDVPPLLRGVSGIEPQRLNIGLRFT
jgi:hypothetical protein